jgi:hypothetical protein
LAGPPSGVVHITTTHGDRPPNHPPRHRPGETPRAASPILRFWKIPGNTLRTCPLWRLRQRSHQSPYSGDLEHRPRAGAEGKQEFTAGAYIHQVRGHHIQRGRYLSKVLIQCMHTMAQHEHGEYRWWQGLRVDVNVGTFLQAYMHALLLSWRRECRTPGAASKLVRHSVSFAPSRSNPHPSRKRRNYSNWMPAAHICTSQRACRDDVRAACVVGLQPSPLTTWHMLNLTSVFVRFSWVIMS